jgi:hypothetical protein
MCGGGGGGGATITSPNYMQNTQMLQMQLEAMRSQREGVLGLAQNQLNAELSNQTQTLQELQFVKQQRANETSANAARMAALIGTPLPEKSAEAPKVGEQRAGQVRAQGKQALRIDSSRARTSGTGVGLNLT